MPGHCLGTRTGQGPPPRVIWLQAPCSEEVKGLSCLHTSCWAIGSSAKEQSLSCLIYMYGQDEGFGIQEPQWWDATYMNFAILDATLKYVFLSGTAFRCCVSWKLCTCWVIYYCFRMARKGLSPSSLGSRHKIMWKKCEMTGREFCSGVQRNYRRFIDCCWHD